MPLLTILIPLSRVLGRQGPRLSIRIDIWILPSDTIRVYDILPNKSASWLFREGIQKKTELFRTFS